MKLSKKMATMMAAAALLSGMQMAAANTTFVVSTPSEEYTTDVVNNVNSGNGAVGRYYLYTDGWDAVTAPDRQKTKVTFSNMNFTDNTVKNTGTTAKTGDTSGGAAVFIKGADVTFNDVGFTGNTVTSESGALSNGGAVFVDSTRNNHNYDASVTFNVSKDMAYTGNKVTGVSNKYSDTYGSIATTSGGFLYMDRGTTANFNIDEGATLTIGKEGENDDNTDSIASSIKTAGQTYSENAIYKKGKGTLTVNGQMKDYHGDLNVNEGTMNINQGIAGDAQISVASGATLNLKAVEFSSQLSESKVVTDHNGNTATIQLPERNGSLVAKAGSNVTAKSITLKDKSSMKVETGAAVKAQSVSVQDDATLRAESHSNLDVKQVKVDPAKKGHVQLMGDFSGQLVKSDGTALTAAETQNVMAKADNDNSRMDITAQNVKSATSLLQGDDGSFTIQNKDYANGGATKVLASYDKDGTYDAHGNDMKNVGAISAKSLSVGQIGDVETAINKNAADIKQNADGIQQNKADIQKNKAAIQQNAAGIQRLDGRIDKVGANAAALAALHPLDYDASEKWSVAAGVGNYGSENAMAVGAFYRPNEDVMLNMAGSFGSGENMVNAGISFKVGQRGAKVVKAEGADVKALQEKVEAQDKEIRELREMVEKLAAKA